MNQTIESILARHSVRSYDGKPVERDDLEQILRCGQFAATAMGRQPWHFSVVANRALLDEISAANQAIMMQSPDETVREMAAAPNFDNFRGAPVAVIISGDSSLSSYAEADCANATENMAIAAYSLGLGSCYIASFKIVFGTPAGDELKKKLGIPDGFQPYFALAIGHGKEEKPRAPRRENTISWID